MPRQPSPAGPARAKRPAANKNTNDNSKHRHSATLEIQNQTQEPNPPITVHNYESRKPKLRPKCKVKNKAAHQMQPPNRGNPLP